ncbi:MAG: hypothetical protein NWQ27_01555 [Crocinitomicaceae bacterium]|jgi:hypothetical protein|nr:hypothetical protein [Crocinitomicaceae bacterium]
MKFRFLNKTIQNQRFNYNPMYYNERKERLDRKREQYQKLEDNTISDAERRELFRENLKEGFSRAHYRQTQQRSSNIRVLILIGLILLLGYFVFNGVNEVDTVVKKLW